MRQCLPISWNTTSRGGRKTISRRSSKARRGVACSRAYARCSACHRSTDPWRSAERRVEQFPSAAQTLGSRAPLTDSVFLDSHPLLLGIALAGGEADRQRALDVGELRFRQIDFSRLGAFL